MNKQWFVIYTKAKREVFASRELAEKGFVTFCPMFKDHCWNKGNIIERKTPLFPGYLFVHFSLDTDYHRVKWTPGVNKVIGYGDNPVPLKDEIIEFLKGIVNEDGILSKKTLQRGDHVIIKDGPFRGFKGILEDKASPSGRIKVLMECVSYSTRIEVPEILVESVV
jgi:transcription elongation factor/antiterminator RfaH